jgi:hypothetical protein
LWREYAEATRRHVHLLKEQERLGALAPAEEREIDLAGMRRDSLRAGIRVHLAVDHANEPSLTVEAGARS